MNQVYFYVKMQHGIDPTRRRSLNPFMNQVYFYPPACQGAFPAGRGARLNPFMNQVYFYIAHNFIDVKSYNVLIPL